MNIAVVMRQVPDLIEPLEVNASGAALDLDAATFIVNESDDHALEQALLMKEADGGTVTVVAIDFGDVDNTLYAASAKGADRVLKIPWEDESAAPRPQVAARMLAEAIRPLEVPLVLIGMQAHDELDGVLAPLLSTALGLPYVGVIRGVEAVDPCTVRVWKEFPGAVMSRMRVKLPAVLGILGAEQPPRYVPVSRIRAAMKTARFEEVEVALPELAGGTTVLKLHPPEVGRRAEILEGGEAEVAQRIAAILAEKGLIK